MNDANLNETYQGKIKDGKGNNTIYNWTAADLGNGSRSWVMDGTTYSGPTMEEGARLSNHVYNLNEEGYDPGTKRGMVGNWSLIKEYGTGTAEKYLGYKAGLYRREIDGEYFYAMAFAGTDDPMDAAADYKTGLRLKPDYQTARAHLESRRISEWIEKNTKGNNLTFVGHSLGGGLATVAAISTNRKAITFNAMGIPGNLEILYSRSFSNNSKALINAYIIKGEVLNKFQLFQADGMIHYVNPKSGSSSSFDRHSIDQFLK